MSLIEEKTLADHDINVKSIRQELQLLEEQLKKHGRNEIQPSLTATDPDTVSRQQAIDAIVDRCDVAKWGRCPKTEELVWTLEKLPSSPTPSRQAEPHWIPCSERLPEEGERVLATHLGGLNPNRQVIEHIYQNGEFACGWEMDTDFHSPTFGQRLMGKVIAWMPLPEPYQEGQE